METWSNNTASQKESVLDKKNFRPVTVLPAFAKVFEKIIHMQITEHFESIFHDYMFAYRKFHGCPAALLTLTEDWRAELDKRKVIGAVAIDLSKAFDCLPHELLLEKLKFYGVSDNSVALLRSYLSCRYQRVKLGHTFSTWMGVSAGVPQGSLLGPLLFNIFMNDLGNTAHDFDIKCEEKPIPVSSEIQLLGVTLHNKLKFDSHIASICRKVGRQVNALNRLKNVLPCRTKEALYRTFILLHFDYCSQIWHHCGARNARKLERVNERALRFVYKDKNNSYDRLLNWIGLHSTLERCRIQDMLITINSCFQEKAPTPIVNLLKVKDTKYNLRGTNMLSWPKVRSTKHGVTI